MAEASCGSDSESELEATEEGSTSCCMTTDESVGSCNHGMPTQDSSAFSRSIAVSLLSKLQSPPPSELARKRKVRKNPPKGVKQGKGSVIANSKGVAPVDRVQAYQTNLLM